MKILVLGGSGFVGKRLLENLKTSKQYELYSLSRKEGLDLTNFNQTKKWFSKIKPDIIFNLAAHVGSVHYVTTYAADIISDNLLMTLNIYRAAKDIIPNVKIINPLSNCSYPGDSQNQLESEWWNGEVHESVFSYGNYKRMLYVISKCYHMQYHIKSINFLIPNTFGPGDSIDPNKTHALNGMIIRMINAKKKGDEEFEIWGTGSPVREWAYIDDVINILSKGLEISKELIYPVNIAQNKGFTIKDSAYMIRDILQYEGKIVFNTSYKDGAPIKILDDTNFRKFFPNYKFYEHSEGIRHTIEYYEKIL